MTESKDRKRELEDLINRKKRLTADEYLEILYELQKNATIRLLLLTIQGTTRETGCWLNIMDKVHWLIDSAEKKGGEKPRPIIVRFATQDELNGSD